MSNHREELNVFSVYGVEEFDRESTHWNPEEFLRWLRDGFRTLSDPAKSSLWHSAFPPLQLSPESSPIGQLTGALADARHADLSCAKRTRTAIEWYFDTPEASSVDARQLSTSLWQLYSTFDPDESITPRARRFLRAVLKADPGACRDSLSDLVDAVAAAVSAAPLTPAQLAFFQYLSRHEALWDDRYVVLILEQMPSQPRTQRYVLFWNEIRKNFGAALARVTDPDTVGGRVLLGEISNALNPKANRERSPYTPEEARKRLHQLDIRGDRLGSVRRPPDPEELQDHGPLYQQLAAMRKP